MKSPRIIFGVAQGVADLGRKVVFEAGQQTAKIAEEGIEEVVGAKSNQSPTDSKPLPFSPKDREEELKEIERLRRELRQTGRKVEEEITAVRRKKKEKEKEREEEFLRRLAEKRKKEKEEAKKDAEGGILPGSRRPKRGSALMVHQKQRPEFGRGAKN